MSYLGNEPIQEQYLDKKEYTATEGQTVFSCLYDDRVDVYINGILLSSTDFIATTGTDIVLVTGATAGDVVQIDGWMNKVEYFNGISQSEEFTATEGQTTFTTNYDVGYVQVFLNGVRLDTADYTATNGTSIILNTGATAGDVIFVEAFGTFALSTHYTSAETDTLLAGKSDTTHNHDGTYEPADATILKDADIGVTVLSPTGDGSQLTGIETVIKQATAPTSPVQGMQWFNTTDQVTYAYTTTAGWMPMHEASLYTTATGGTVSTDGDYKVHTFTSSGTFTVTQVGTDNTVEYLVVAGGGGGGSDRGGGGGAGGMRSSYNSTGGGCSQEGNLVVAAQGYTVTIGGGGAGAPNGGSWAGNGVNSVFGSITSIGGGRGGTDVASGSGGNGGSGGGAKGGTAGLGTSCQGYNGAGGSVGGAGGGAGGVGTNSGDPSTAGPGVSNSIGGGAVTYAAGGRGANSATNNDPAGAANSGNGGPGGGYPGYQQPGKAGGSGIVIVRYKFQQE